MTIGVNRQSGEKRPSIRMKVSTKTARGVARTHTAERGDKLARRER